jgi:hypothetical protein
MLFLADMGNAANDNEEPNTFMSLGLATALLINRIRNAQTLLELVKANEEKEERRPEERDNAGAQQNNSPEHTEAVNRRLRDLAAFERRANGKHRP